MKKGCRKPWMKGIGILTLLVLILSGCINQPLEGEERQRWVDIADPIAENILQTLNSNDYQGHIKDYSQEMIDATTPEEFANLKETLDSKIGAYISKTPGQVIRDDGYIVVFYSAQFENEDNVTVRVVFKEDDETHKVYGLWFDSPKLRE